MMVQQKWQKNTPAPIIFSHPTLDEVLESAILAPEESSEVNRG
jgi:hypothetical protein